MFLLRFKTQINLLNLLKYATILMLAWLFFACEKEEEMISGCTNPNAINYSSEATVNDSSCAFLRDQYLRNYNITTSNCTKEDFWEDLSVTIEANPNNDSGIFLKIRGFLSDNSPIELSASVDEDGITLSEASTYFLNSPVVGGTTKFLNIYDGAEYVAVTFSMSGKLEADGDNLNGRLSFDVVDAQNEELVSVPCDYVWTSA